MATNTRAFIAPEDEEDPSTPPRVTIARPTVRAADVFDFERERIDPRGFTNPAVRRLFSDDIDRAEKAAQIQRREDDANAAEAERAQRAQAKAAEQAAEEARKAEIKRVNAANEATFRTHGVENYIDSYGVIQPVRHEDGRVRFAVGEDGYKVVRQGRDEATGNHYRVKIDAYGDQHVEDANEYQVFEDEPSVIYRGGPNASKKPGDRTGWEKYAGLDEANEADSPSLRAAAMAGKTKLKERLLKTALGEAERERIEADLGIEQWRNQRAASAQKLKEIEAEASALSEVANEQTEGFLGFGKRGTPNAEQAKQRIGFLQSEAATLREQLGDVTSEDAAMEASPEASALVRKRSTRAAEIEGFRKLVDTEGDVLKAARKFRELLPEDQRKSHPILAAIAAEKQRLGLREPTDLATTPEEREAQLSAWEKSPEPAVQELAKKARALNAKVAAINGTGITDPAKRMEMQQQVEAEQDELQKQVEQTHADVQAKVQAKRQEQAKAFADKRLMEAKALLAGRAMREFNRGEKIARNPDGTLGALAENIGGLVPWAAQEITGLPLFGDLEKVKEMEQLTETYKSRGMDPKAARAQARKEVMEGIEEAAGGPDQAAAAAEHANIIDSGSYGISPLTKEFVVADSVYRDPQKLGALRRDIRAKKIPGLQNDAQVAEALDIIDQRLANDERAEVEQASKLPGWQEANAAAGPNATPGEVLAKWKSQAGAGEVLWNAVRKLGGGAVGLLESAVGGAALWARDKANAVAEWSGADWLKTSPEEFAQALESWINPEKSWAGAIGGRPNPRLDGVLSQTADTIGQQIPGLLAAFALSKVPGGKKAAGKAAMAQSILSGTTYGLQNAASNYKRIFDSMVTRDESGNIVAGAEEAHKAAMDAFRSSFAVGVSELAPLERVFDKIPMEGMQNLVGKITKSLGEEIAQETLATKLNNVITTGYSGGAADTEDLTPESLMAMTIGMGAVIAPAIMLKHRSQAKWMTKNAAGIDALQKAAEGVPAAWTQYQEKIAPTPDALALGALDPTDPEITGAIQSITAAREAVKAAKDLESKVAAVQELHALMSQHAPALDRITAEGEKSAHLNEAAAQISGITPEAVISRMEGMGIAPEIPAQYASPQYIQRQKDRAAGIIKLATGRQDLMSKAEEQAIATDHLGNPIELVYDQDGAPIIEERARQALIATVPAAKKLFPATEVERKVKVAQEKKAAEAAKAAAGAQGAQGAQPAPGKPTVAPAPLTPVEDEKDEIPMGNAPAAAAPGVTTTNAIDPATFGPEQKNAVDDFGTWLIAQGIPGPEAAAMAQEFVGLVPSLKRYSRTKAFTSTRSRLSDFVELRGWIPQADGTFARAATKPAEQSVAGAVKSFKEASQVRRGEPVEPYPADVAKTKVSDAIKAEMTKAGVEVEYTKVPAESGGMVYNIETGKVMIDPDRVVADLRSLPEEKHTERLRTQFNEEVVHAVHMRAARALHAKHGKPGEAFVPFIKRWYGDMWNDPKEFPPAVRAAVLELRGATEAKGKDGKPGKDDWKLAIEGIRMLVQQRASGTMSEVFKQWVKDLGAQALETLRAMLAVMKQAAASDKDFGSRVKNDIAAIEAIMAEQSGKVAEQSGNPPAQSGKPTTVEDLAKSDVKAERNVDPQAFKEQVKAAANEVSNDTGSGATTPTTSDTGGDQGFQNSALAYAKRFTDRPDAQTIAVKGFDSLSVDRQRVVVSHVARLVNNPQILKAVIQSIPVDVVNMLMGKKASAEELLHDPSMLARRLTISSDGAVLQSVGRFIDAFTSAVMGLPANGGAKKDSLSGVNGPSAEGGSTVSASAGDRLDTGATTKDLGGVSNLTSQSSDGRSTGATGEGNSSHMAVTVAGQSGHVDITPTPAQKEAGNYQKLHIKVAGLDISIENPIGSSRKGVDKNGKAWSVKMRSHYGYIKRTEGADGDHIDVFVKDGTTPKYAGKVFVIDQVKPGDGTFDEHKVVIGAKNEAQARGMYLANYTPGWKGLGGVREFTLDEFKAWLASPESRKPAALKGKAKLRDGLEKAVAKNEAKKARTAKKEQLPPGNAGWDTDNMASGSLSSAALTGNPAFYSRLEKAIDSADFGRSEAKPPIQWAGVIQKWAKGWSSAGGNLWRQGISQDEIKWSGIMTWLSEQKRPLTKAEVLDYVRGEGAVRFEEVKFGESVIAGIAAKYGYTVDTAYEDGAFIDQDGEMVEDEDLPPAMLKEIENITDSKYQQHALSGGENYREVVVTMLSKKRTKDEALEAWKADARSGKRGKYSEDEIAGMTVDDVWEILRDEYIEKGIGYTEPHFPEAKNYVAHYRAQDFKDGMIIDEMQATGHQEARKKGYRGEGATLPQGWTVEEVPVRAYRGGPQTGTEWMVFDGSRTQVGFGAPTREAAIRSANAGETGQGIPDAPYRKTWPLMLFKRALREAVETGKTWIGWPAGKVHADRYSLAKQVDSVTIRRNPGGTWGVYAAKDGRGVIDTNVDSDEKLADTIGKDLANQAIKDLPNPGAKNYSGLDLEVGGEGMAVFYDEIVPQTVGKYVRQWGAKVEESNLETGDAQWDLWDANDGYYVMRNESEVAGPFESWDKANDELITRSEPPIWRVDITPEMRASVTDQGQSLFSAPLAQPTKAEAAFNFTVATSRNPQVAKLLAEGRWDEVHRLNDIAVKHAMSDLPGVTARLEPVVGRFQGPGDAEAFQEPASRVVVTYKDDADLGAIRARMADLAELWDQDEFHEVSPATVTPGARFGVTQADGTTLQPAFEIETGDLTGDEVGAMAREEGINGLSMADGRVLLYNVGPEAYNFQDAAQRLTQRIADRRGVQPSSEGYGIALRRYGRATDPEAGVIGYEDSRVRDPRQAGALNRLRTELSRRIPELTQRIFAPPQARSFFTKKDVTPRQVELQKRIADVFETLPDDDLANPLVRRAYEELNRDLVAQWDVLTSGPNGLKFYVENYFRPDPLTGERISGDLYPSSKDAVRDLRERRMLRVLKTDPSAFGPEGADFSAHPLLRDSGRVDAEGTPLNYNDVLRAVHDALAHGMFSDQFGAVGEEAAWNVHIRTIDNPWSRWALTTETRGQNSWVNYGPQMRGQDGAIRQAGDPGYLTPQERSFARQKAALLPLEFTLTGDAEVDAPTLQLMQELGDDARGSAPETLASAPLIRPSKLSTKPTSTVKARATSAIPVWEMEKSKSSLPKAAIESPAGRVKLYRRIDEALDFLRQDPTAIATSRGWTQYLRTAGVWGEIPMPPSALREIIENPDAYVAKLNGGYHEDKTLPGAKESANAGLDGTVEMRRIIGEGKAPAPFAVALHHFWGILSRMLPPLQQEAAWLRLISQREVLDQIQRSIDGDYSLTQDEWSAIVSKGMRATPGAGIIGNQGTANANSFHLMLDRWNGKWGEVAGIYTKPNAQQMGRAFWDLDHGPVGIKNKVQRFIGLTFGVPGVIMDRWKFVEFWLPTAMEGTGAAAPRDYFKYVMGNTPEDPLGIYGVYGLVENSNPNLSLALYEGFELALQAAIDKSPSLQAHLGAHTNPGGMHWHGWNAIKNEAVGHSSLDLTKDLITKFGADIDAGRVYNTISEGRYYTEGEESQQRIARVYLDGGQVRVERMASRHGERHPGVHGRGAQGGDGQSGRGAPQRQAVAAASIPGGLASAPLQERSVVTPQQDAKYAAAVKRGDMEAAQKMVDEAAKAAGYSRRVYHGTEDGGFTVFDPTKTSKRTGFVYVSTGKGTAASYSGSRRYKPAGDEGRGVWTLYVKEPQWVFDFEEADWTGQKPNGDVNEYHDFGGIDGIARDAHQSGITSFEVQNVLDEGPNGDTAWYDSTIAVADPSLIKSADPVTRDADGNVIPLSQRFNPKSDSILYSAPATPPPDPAKLGTWAQGPLRAVGVPESALNRGTVALARWAGNKAKEGANAISLPAAVAKLTNSAPGKRFGQAARVAREQLLPKTLLPREVAAWILEARAAIAWSARANEDLMKTIKAGGKAKFDDGFIVPEAGKDPDVQRQMARYFRGEIPIDDLPKGVHDWAKKITKMWDERGRAMVDAGIMSWETYSARRAKPNSYFPHMYVEEELNNTGLRWTGSRLKMFLDRVKPQLSTAFYIFEKNPVDGSAVRDKYDVPKLVTHTGKQWRFNSARHRDEWFKDFVRQETVKQMRSRGLTFDIDDLDALALQSKETQALVSIAQQNIRSRFGMGEPTDLESLERAGLVTNLSYVVPKSLAQMDHDIALAKLFRDIADNPAYVADVAISGYTEVPNDRRFGKLAGKWLENGIYQELLELREAPDLAWQIYDRALAKWKMWKTVYNPSTHFRNVLGNLFFADLAGVGAQNPQNAGLYRDAWKALKGDLPEAPLQEMYESGLLGGDYASAELQSALNGIPFETEDGKEKSPMDVMMAAPWRFAKGVGEKFSGAYELEDSIPKVAAYLKARRAGASVPEAVAHVRKWFPYYDQVGRSATIRATKRLASPFLSFMQEAVRIGGRAMMEKPITFAKWLAMPSLISAVSRFALGLDDEDEEAIARDMNGQAFGMPLFSALMPIPDSKGRPVQWDFSNVIPYADMLGQRMGESQDKPMWSSMIHKYFLSGPITQLAIAWGQGRDPYTGKDFKQTDMTDAEALAAQAKYTGKLLLPPLTPGVGTSNPVAVFAGPDRTGRFMQERSRAQEAARKFAGIDVKSAEPNLYRSADEFRKANGLPQPPEFNDSTAKSRIRREVYDAMVQSDVEVLAEKLVELRERTGDSIASAQDVNRLFYYRRPDAVIPRKADRDAWIKTLSPMEKQVLDKANAEFERVRRNAVDLIRRAEQLKPELKVAPSRKPLTTASISPAPGPRTQSPAGMLSRQSILPA